MTRPQEADYKSYVSYTRALEEYCDVIEHALNLSRFPRSAQKLHEIVQEPAEIRRVFELDAAEYPEPTSGFMKL